MNINKLMADFEEANRELIYDDKGGLTELGKFALMGLSITLAFSIIDRLYPGIRNSK